MSLISWADDKPKEEIDKFQGTWIVSRVEIKGMKQPQSFTIKLTFDGDKLLTTVGKREPESQGTFKIDPKREPNKGYDVTTTDGRVARGIYELDGDTLKVCLSGPDDEAPDAFETKQGDNRTLIVYKREKPTKGK
jgi:uncharacterized protein (TIGR03067 family)